MKRIYFSRLTDVSVMIVFCLLLLSFTSTSVTGEKPLIFPIPQEMEVLGYNFELDENTSILIPQNTSENDLLLARFLVRELSDKYGLALKIECTSDLPHGKNVIVMGTIDNPLVKEYCSQQKIEVTAENPGSEGYVMKVDKNVVVIAGWDDCGAFYGLQSLRQIINEDDGFQIPCVKVRDWPNLPFRGIRLYIPGNENIAFFKRFLRDFMALFKFNKVIIEVNCMRLDRHPEVNAGWIEYANYMNYTRSSELAGIHGQTRNSGHQDAGDGGIVEKDDVKDIIQFANQNYIEAIPEIPSLTHGYYLLTRHPELAEYKDAIWPDTYCPLNPKSYELLFDVFDEYIEVINPKMIHIGHDEWWGAPLGVCPRCSGKDYSELFAHDINSIYNYLEKKDIKIAMWGDHLLESVRGKGPKDRTSPTGYKYQTAGGLRPAVVESSIPKDILIFNWFWGKQERDIELQQFGFKQLYGNFKPNIRNWKERIKKVDVVGGAPSSWAATNEFNFGKDLIYDFLGCANLLWSNRVLEQAELGEIVRNLTPMVRRNLSGKRPPSEGGDPVVPVNIASYFNISSGEKMLDIDLSALKVGNVGIGKKVFKLENPSLKAGKCAVAVGVKGKEKNPFPGKVEGIQINEDVSSLIFLHACAEPAGNQKAYFCVFNTFDSADLLGWYEIVYEDGFKEIIPVQYGVNILEWNAGGDKTLDKRVGRVGSPQSAYCYGADAVNCSSAIQDNPITFFAFEWVNKRFGKKIKEINLNSSVEYGGLKPVFSHVVTEVIPNNAIMLIALSTVKKREIHKIK